MNIIAICGVESKNIAIQLSEEYSQFDNLEFRSCIESYNEREQIRINGGVDICIFTDSCINPIDASYWNIYYMKSGMHMHSIRHVIRMLIV